MKQRLRESWKPLLNTIPAFKGSAECLARRKFLKIIHSLAFQMFLLCKQFTQFKTHSIAYVILSGSTSLRRFPNDRRPKV